MSMYIAALVCLIVCSCQSGRQQTTSTPTPFPERTPFDDSAAGRQDYLEGYHMGYSNGVKGEVALPPHDSHLRNNPDAFAQGFWAGTRQGLDSFAVQNGK